MGGFDPHLYKTTDYGRSWTKIVRGIPDGPLSYTHVLREDTKRKGLLYAGTETGVYVSFDDGANWQSLQLNLPTSPVHDLVVKDNDLAVATHGRSFWILDDLAPLRQMNAQVSAAPAHLFTPSSAWRYRGGGWGGPLSGYPPNGAIVYYNLKEKPKGEMTLEILDASGTMIRKHAECLQVVQWLNDEALDLLEVSGGTYEQPRLIGAEGRAADAVPVQASTRAREAYFLEYAAAIRRVAHMPLMVNERFPYAGRDGSGARGGLRRHRAWPAAVLPARISAAAAGPRGGLVRADRGSAALCRPRLAFSRESVGGGEDAECLRRAGLVLLPAVPPGRRPAGAT